MAELTDPETHGRQLTKEMNAELDAAYDDYNEKVATKKKEVSASRSLLQSEISRRNKIDPGARMFTGAIVGGVVGLFICIPQSYDIGMGGAFFVWIICIIAGAAILGLISGAEKDTSDYENQITALNKKEGAQLENLELDYQKRKAEIQIKYDALKKQHLNDYEKKQRATSQKYIGSAVAQEITEFVLEPFINTIDAADRRPHIKQVNIPLSFEVFKNKVETPYGNYDFTIKRVQELGSIDDVAALATAIATAIHTYIITYYPVDASGGEVTPMEINYGYKSSSVRVTMSYIAVNANYVEARSF